MKERSYNHNPTKFIFQGNDSAARKSLQFFRGKKYNIDRELNEIKANIEKTKAEHVSLRQSFTTRAAKMSLFISLGLMFFQQMSGVNAVIFYTETIFKVKF